MKLVLFDIDGTLTISDGFGRRCFLDAVASEFGITDASSDWGAYEHVTDAGISRQILREHHGSEPGEREIERLHDAYHRRLELALAGQPDAYVALEGSAAALAGLAASPNWCVGIASGNWRRAGRMKLCSAGLTADGFACGYADDAIEKPRILAAAIEAARVCAKLEFSSIVYVGDAPWDVRAATELGIGFVGVSHGRTGKEGLRSTTEYEVVRNYEDLGRFEAVLQRARPLALGDGVTIGRKR